MKQNFIGTGVSSQPAHGNAKVIEKAVANKMPISGILHELSNKADLKVPELMVLDTPKKIAEVDGTIRKPVIKISTGVISELNPAELEALGAHELGHTTIWQGIVRAAYRVVGQALHQFGMDEKVGKLLDYIRASQEKGVDAFALKLTGNAAAFESLQEKAKG